MGAQPSAMPGQQPMMGAQPQGAVTQQSAQPTQSQEPGWREYPVDPNALGKPQEGFEFQLGPGGMPQYRTKDDGTFITDDQGRWIPKMRNREQEAADIKTQGIQTGRENAFDRVEQVREAIQRLRDNSSLHRVVGLGGLGVKVPIPGTGGSQVEGTVADLTAWVGQVLGIANEPARKAAEDIKQAQADMQFVRGSGVLTEMAKARQGSAQGATGFGNLTEGERQLLENVGSNGLDTKVGLSNFRDQLTRLDKIMSSQGERVKGAGKLQAKDQAGKNTPDVLEAAKAELAKGNAPAKAKPKSVEERLDAIGEALGLW